MLCSGWAWGPQRYRTSHRPRDRATCISTYGCSLRTGPSLCSSLFSWSSGFISQAVCIPKMTFSLPNQCSARSLVSEPRRFLGRDSALELWPSVWKSWLSLGIRGPLLWISGYFPNIAEGSCPGKGEGNFGEEGPLVYGIVLEDCPGARTAWVLLDTYRCADSQPPLECLDLNEAVDSICRLSPVDLTAEETAFLVPSPARCQTGGDLHP